MIAEHSYVVLTRDIRDQNLAAGDVGVVIHIHRSAPRGPASGYMLELFTAEGRSLQEVSVPADAVRPATDADRMHVRSAAAK